MLPRVAARLRGVETGHSERTTLGGPQALLDYFLSGPESRTWRVPRRPLDGVAVRVRVVPRLRVVPRHQGVTGVHDTDRCAWQTDRVSEERRLVGRSDWVQADLQCLIYVSRGRATCRSSAACHDCKRSVRKVTAVIQTARKRTARGVARRIRHYLAAARRSGDPRRIVAAEAEVTTLRTGPRRARQPDNASLRAAVAA